ncbi:MAG: hypothetical protein J5I92_01650 [Thiogranum sp.]|nr:hypothetical protein [Thiogranum sp.]
MLAAVYPDAAAARAAVAALDVSAADAIEVLQLVPDSSTGLTDATGQQKVRDALLGDPDNGAAATLFVSAPVVGPLIVLGYGAEIAGVAGAVRGLQLHRDLLAALVKDALTAGYYAVIVHAEREDAQRRARDVINASMAEDARYS